MTGFNSPVAIQPVPLQGLDRLRRLQPRLGMPRLQQFATGGALQAPGGSALARLRMMSGRVSSNLPDPGFPPASSGYGPGGEPTGGQYTPPGGPTVILNPPDLQYTPPSLGAPGSPNGGTGSTGVPTLTGTTVTGTPPSAGGWDPYGNSVNWGAAGGIGPQGNIADTALKSPPMIARYL